MTSFSRILIFTCIYMMISPGLISCFSSVANQQESSKGHRPIKKTGNIVSSMQEVVPGFGSLTGGDSKQVAKSRRRRATFAWPDSTVFVADFSIEMPFRTPEGVSIPFYVEAPYEFILPNITDQVFFKKRSIDDRVNIFGTIEGFLSRMGMDGHECMLKTVCERAQKHVVVQGLLGEILDLVLAVSSLEEGSLGLMDFMDASTKGKHLQDCAVLYPKCPFSLFQYID